ncbi:unnamed protein product [Cylicocyclus nassatus]|uniref:Uncharacterized protein n=1 Tax=Cylicocyclus nassatus TaxID=53992 RepID=A0AA36GVA7_CYLNA|nr:unnamed protein product [Cylicocyclus nassatus]
MGNCISFKKKKDVTREHPTVSKWLASCDFSSVPDIDDFIVEEESQNRMVYESVLGGDTTAVDLDGYITALENLESEDERSGEKANTAAPSSSDETQHQVDSCTFGDEESIYETSDELPPTDPPAEVPNTPMFSARTACAGDEAEEEENDVVEDLAKWRTNYDDRPICPLPTPFRKNLISPRTDLETLVDSRGKVRRTQRVKLYLEEKRQHAQVS